MQSCITHAHHGLPAEALCGEQELLQRISTWLQPQGLLFVHIFCHKRFAYHFEVCAWWQIMGAGLDSLPLSTQLDSATLCMWQPTAPAAL